MFSLLVLASGLFASVLATDEAVLKYYKSNDGLCGIGVSQWFPNNDFSSAFPLMKQMYLLSTASTDEKKNEILNILNLSTDNAEEALNVIKTVFAKFNVQNDDRYSAKMEVKFYTNSLYEISDTFQQSMSDIFQGSVEALDFSNGDNAVSTISSFLGAEAALKASELSTATCLIPSCVTTINLKWAENAFRPYRKTVLAFKPYGEETTTDVNAWYGEGYGKYAEVDDLKAYIFDLQADFSAVYVSVNENKLNDTLNKFRDPQYLADILNIAESKYMKLTIPLRETYTVSRDYKPELQKANMLTELFDANYDGLDKVYKNSKAYVSDMLSHITLNLETPTEDQTKTIEPDSVFDRSHFFFYLCPEKSILAVSLQTQVAV